MVSLSQHFQCDAPSENDNGSKTEDLLEEYDAGCEQHGFDIVQCERATRTIDFKEESVGCFFQNGNDYQPQRVTYKFDKPHMT
jgi:hypothetical protein